MSDSNNNSNNSVTDFYSSEITLIDKSTTHVTPILIKGDGTMGNLTPYRMSAKYNDTINGTTKNGQITLRCPAGLFDTISPILTDENVKDKYLIQIQLRQKNSEGQKFRFEISNVTNNIGSGGNHITLSLTAYDIRIEEFLDSENILLQTPRESFNKRIRNFLLGRDLTRTGSIKLTYVNSQNMLPDDDNLKQDWLSTEPLITKQLLDEIISRVSTPQRIGSTNEDWFYSIVPQADTESFRIFIDKFGEIDSGVILDVSTNGNSSTAVSEINSIFDNTKFKNAIILNGKKGTHTIPMDYTRLASDITHAKISAPWQIGQSFKVGYYTRFENTYYKCRFAHTASAANTPVFSSTFWENLLTTTRGSPWTINHNLWKANMNDSITPPSGYVGFFNDFNIVRKNYDLDDVFSEFEGVSVKDVEGYITNPSNIPNGEIIHGKRWLVNGNTPNTPWSNHTNQIAQYDESVSPSVWRFSKNPVTGDIVNLLSTAQVLRFNGTIWDTIWSLSTNPQVSSPFFPVESLSKVSNRHGIRKAVEFRFNWNVFDSNTITSDIINLVQYVSGITGITTRLLGVDLGNATTDSVSGFLAFLGLQNDTRLVETFGIGNAKNKAGRRYGFNIKLPFPKRTVTNSAIGSQIKKSTIDFNNLSESIITGEKGWNNGIISEDLGGMRGLEFWVKLLHQNNRNLEINGIANVPMIFWFRDLFDRVVFYRFTIRAHNSWLKITIPAGPDSGLEQFDSRIDDLFTAFGYTFPFNHFIKDRELTGATFDWRYVKEMGCFNQESYDDNFLYKAGQNSYLDIVTEHALQYVIKNPTGIIGVISDSVTGKNYLPLELVITDHVLFAIDDINFIKDAYVTTENAPVAAPRLKKVNAANQYDYYNMKQIALRKKSRLQYHPEKHIIYCRGNVNLKPGKKFTISGAFGFSKVLVANSVSHIEDSTGYHCEIEAIRKYEV